MKYMMIAALLGGATGGADTRAAQDIAPSREVARMHEILAGVSASRIKADITKLVDFGTRHTMSDTTSETRGIGAARRWIEAEMKSIAASCSTDVDVFTVSDTVKGRRLPKPTEVVNVVAIQKGKLDPKRVVMMSGDIDSRVSNPLNNQYDSPGANDNASGMAGVIEALRVLCNTEFAGSVVYAGLSGEEQGLYGGRILADYAVEQGWRIDAVLNNDMIGNIEGIDGVIDNSTVRVFSEGTRVVETKAAATMRRFWGGEVDSPSRNVARMIDVLADRYVPNLDVMMVYRLDRFGRGGHHRPFNEAGFPGVRLMETHEHYDRQHQDLRTENGVKYGDVLEKVDFDYAAKVTKLNVAALAQMAASPPMPMNVTLAGRVSPDTLVSWAMPYSDKQLENLKGFRVYWRLTDQPKWQWSRFVPAHSREHRLENIVIDNYFFGVTAVAKDGHETPVVFPGPMGSFGPWKAPRQ